MLWNRRRSRREFGKNKLSMWDVKEFREKHTKRSKLEEGISDIPHSVVKYLISKQVKLCLNELDYDYDDDDDEHDDDDCYCYYFLCYTKHSLFDIYYNIYKYLYIIRITYFHNTCK